MEDYRGIVARCILNVRKLILDAHYYKYDRADWEEDYSKDRLIIAEINLKQAETVLKALERKIELERRAEQDNTIREGILGNHRKVE